jgi:hypothetical protein
VEGIVRYEEVLNLIAESVATDWNKITAWGGGGPSFLYGFPDENGEWTSHEEVAAYKPDLSIGLAWGIVSNDDFKEPWANLHTDPHATSEFVDIFYNRMLVYRDIRVIVDGGRVGLPIPERVGERRVISTWQYRFFGLIQELVGGGGDFATYVRSSGFEVA